MQTMQNNATTTTNNQTSDFDSKPHDIIQEFDHLLKNHSIVVSDRENLVKLFECIVDLCTQMPKTKLKAALKAATQAPKTKGKAQPKPKPNPKTKAPMKTNSKEVMVGPDGAADAPVISDLVVEVEVARGRGRPRKMATEIVTENANATTAEKKRRGRPKKDKTVTISSNDDEDALIAQMMADVASMQKNEEHNNHSTEVEVEVPVTTTSDDDTDTDESLSPIIQPTFEIHPNEKVDVEKDVVITPPPSKPVKEVKPKPVKEVKPKPVKEVKSKPVKEVKPKPVKEVKANPVKEVKEVKANPVVKVASFSDPVPAQTIVTSSQRDVENQEINGGIYLTNGFPRSSFSYNGKTYLRTETDNVYDNMTMEMIGVWDHANHEIIYAFDDDDDMCFSDEE